MNVMTTTAGVVAEFARVSDFNEYLREATTSELEQQAARMNRELATVGTDVRNNITDILKERLTAVQRVLSLG